MGNSKNGNYAIQCIVVVADFILMNLLLSFFIYFGKTGLPEIMVAHTKVTFLISNFALVIAEYFYHTIIHIRILKISQVFTRVARLAVAQAIIAFVLLKIMWPTGGMFAFFFAYVMTFYVVLLLSRLIERHYLNVYRQKGGNTRTVVFIGNDPANLRVYEQLSTDASTGYKVLGYYADKLIEDAPRQFVRLGTIDDLNKLIDSTESAEELNPKCDELFCSMSHNEYKEIVKIMRFCDQNIIHFYYVPRQFGNYRLQLKTDRIGDIEVLTNYREPLLDPANKFIKRAFDIVFSSVVCLIMLPFIPIIALIIKIQSPGPIFFKQDRTGLNGETFKCYKFRSMHVNKEADKQQATEHDPRKFPFGNFMRKANIDELPQFFNVLKGDMSIVGPRPHMLYHTDVYSKLIDKYMVRHFSKPGITGWAQVTGYRGETKELWQMEERVRRDIWYIENWSMWLDIKIILMTVVSMFKHDKEAY